MNSIYMLISPVSGRIRYIGITKVNIEKRKRRHVTAARNNSKLRVHCWIRSLLNRALEPIVRLIEITEDRSREIFWIAHYRNIGAPLLNSTDGGDGLINPSEFTRRKMSASRKGKKASEATRALLSLVQKGRRHSEETKEKMRKPKTEAHRLAAAAALAKVRESGAYRKMTGDANPMRKNPDLPKRGEDNFSSKLNDWMVSEMRRLHTHGISTVALAKLFHVSQGTAWRIVRYLTWLHVPPPKSPLKPDIHVQLPLIFGR